jgi:cysteine desulfurase
MHSDLVQAAGKIDVDITEMNIDFCTISAHKFGGPLGAACLITKTSLPLKAMIVGGGQERNIRSGTENVPAIIGFGEAANIAKEEIDLRFAHMIKLRNYLESELLKTYDDIEIIGINTNRLPNTTMIVKEGRNSDTTIIALDLKGVAVSSGAACSSGKIEPSHVLSAMGLNDDKKNSALRISLGYNTTQDDIDGFLKIYNEINNK